MLASGARTANSLPPCPQSAKPSWPKLRSTSPGFDGAFATAGDAPVGRAHNTRTEAVRQPTLGRKKSPYSSSDRENPRVHTQPDPSSGAREVQPPLVGNALQGVDAAILERDS